MVETHFEGIVSMGFCYDELCYVSESIHQVKSGQKQDACTPIMVLDSGPCTCHLNGNYVKTTSNNCANITVLHKNNRKIVFFKNCEKKKLNILICTKTAVLHIFQMHFIGGSNSQSVCFVLKVCPNQANYH